MAGPVAIFVLVDIAARARLWGFSRFVVGRFALRRVPGLRFFKVLGSGHGGGFGLRPSPSRMGLFLVFDEAAAAHRFVDSSALLQAWRARSDEFFTVLLHPFSSRGSWAGMALPAARPAPAAGPVATLTRASIRPARAFAFWRHAPSAQRSLQQADGCLLSAGVGEAPLLRQATFSLWRNAADVDAYAKTGAHLAAARAAYRDGYFSESMFVRFVPEDACGVWHGRPYG